MDKELTAEEIIDENTFIKDGLLTIETAKKCMEQYATLQVKSHLEKQAEYIKSKADYSFASYPIISSYKLDQASNEFIESLSTEKE